MANSAATREQKRSKAGKKAAEKNAFYLAAREMAAQPENERQLRLRPRLINGRVVISDGTPREVQPDPFGGYIAKYSEGEFFVLDSAFRPVERASFKQAARAGFHPPWTQTPEAKRIAGKAAIESSKRKRKPRQTGVYA